MIGSVSSDILVRIQTSMSLDSPVKATHLGELGIKKLIDMLFDYTGSNM